MSSSDYSSESEGGNCRYCRSSLTGCEMCENCRYCSNRSSLTECEMCENQTCENCMDLEKNVCEVCSWKYFLDERVTSENWKRLPKEIQQKILCQVLKTENIVLIHQVLGSYVKHCKSIKKIDWYIVARDPFINSKFVKDFEKELELYKEDIKIKGFGSRKSSSKSSRKSSKSSNSKYDLDDFDLPKFSSFTDLLDFYDSSDSSSRKSSIKSKSSSRKSSIKSKSSSRKSSIKSKSSSGSSKYDLDKLHDFDLPKKYRKK